MKRKEGSLDFLGERTTSNRRKVAFPIIILCVIVFSIYGNTFDASWHFDDEFRITKNLNLHLRELSWNSIKLALFSGIGNPDSLYRPVACLSFALNYYFGGLDVFGYHLVNIVIHLFSSIFLFLFILHTLNLPVLKTKYESKSYSIALIATILWAINPIQTQAVTYIVQRMASLAGMFYIISMYFYLKARTDSKTGRKLLFFILCSVSFLMAFGSKENAVMLPMSLLLYETLIIQEETDKFLRDNIKVFFIVIGATLLGALIYLYMKDDTIFSFLKGYGVRPFSIAQRLLTEPRITIFYMTLLLYPVPGRLSLAHSIQISTSLFHPIWTFFSILLVVGVIAYLIYRAKRHPLFSFCFLFFFLNHLIESSIFPLELIYEHRNYVPSMMFFVPIGVGFCKLLERYATEKPMKYIVSGFIVSLLIGLGHSTFVRNFSWKDEKSLWADAVEKAPDQFRVHHNLGKYYQDHGYIEEAIREYEKALKSPIVHRNDEIMIAYFNLGTLHEELGDDERAKYFYGKALKIRSDFSQPLGKLAALYDKEGETDLADQYLLKAMKANPGDPQTNLNMGLYYLKKNIPERAIVHFMVLLKERKLRKKALLYLGIAYKQLGFPGRAAGYLRKAVLLGPRNVTPRLHLVEIFSKTGHKTMGQQEARTIVNMMLQDEALFYQTMDLILKKGHLGNIGLSADLILPIIFEACNGKSGRLQEWKDFIKEKLSR